jgi:heme oxygenase
MLEKNHLETFLINQTDNNFSIGIYTKDNNRKNIGKFMKDLTKYYKNIITDDITEKGGHYISTIRFEK